MSKSGETPFRLKAASALVELAAQMERRHGPPKALALQPEFIIASAAKKLGASADDFSPLDPREMKGAIELLWRKPAPSTLTPDGLAKWLRWAESQWKPEVAVTRLSMALLRNYDPDNPAMPALFDWLAARENLLRGRFGEFARRWSLLRGGKAVEQIAANLAAGDLSVLQQAQQEIRAKITLQHSGLAAAIAELYGQSCGPLELSTVAPVISELLTFLGPRDMARPEHLENRHKAARIALISGVVEMAARDATDDSIAFALEVAFQLACDPRAEPDQWRDIPEAIAEQVEVWLVARTVDTAFQIVEELKTDDAQEWRQRQSFWRQYLPYIRRARLLCAPKARRVADRLKEPSCLLNTYLADHCGLLLELQGPAGARLIVVEINNRAQAMFWPEGQKAAPTFWEREFDGSQMRKNCQNLLSHIPPDGWPAKFAELIAENTGLRPDVSALS